MPGFASGDIPGVSAPGLPPPPTATPSRAMPGGTVPGSVTPLAQPLSIAPPAFAMPNFPGAGKYVMRNGKVTYIYDPEQWQAYAAQGYAPVKFNESMPTIFDPSLGQVVAGGLEAAQRLAQPTGGVGPLGLTAPPGVAPPPPSTGAPGMPGVPVTGGPIAVPPTGNVAPPVLPPGVPTGVPAGIPGGQQTNIFNAIPGENLTIAQMQASNAVELQQMRDTIQRETTAAQERIATLDRQLQEKQVLSNVATQAGNLALAQQHEADASKLAWDKFREEQRVYGLNDEFRKKEFEFQQEIQRAQVSQGQQGQNLQRAGFLANLLANPPAILQNARTLTPELVNYIEGGNTPFQWLLENRTLRPGAPGGY